MTYVISFRPTCTFVHRPIPIHYTRYTTRNISLHNTSIILYIQTVYEVVFDLYSVRQYKTSFVILCLDFLTIPQCTTRQLQCGSVACQCRLLIHFVIALLSFNHVRKWTFSVVSGSCHTISKAFRLGLKKLHYESQAVGAKRDRLMLGRVSLSIVLFERLFSWQMVNDSFRALVTFSGRMASAVAS